MVSQRFETKNVHQAAYTVQDCITSQSVSAGEAVAGSLSLRVQQLDVRCETKTRDNVFVTVVVSVQYQVSGASAHMYSTKHPADSFAKHIKHVVTVSHIAPH